jgi:hypothetical protein
MQIQRQLYRYTRKIPVYSNVKPSVEGVVITEVGIEPAMSGVAGGG